MAGRGTALRAGKAQSSSADVGLHEAGHAISWPLGLRGADFKTAYEQDANKGPLADGYYHQKDEQAGRDEADAESHVEYLRDHAAMKAQYPHLCAYWQHFYEPALAGAPKLQIGSATMENDGIIVMRLRMTQEVAAGDLEKRYVPGAPDDEAVRTCRICAPLALERPVLAPIRNARAAARWATSLSR